MAMHKVKLVTVSKQPPTKTVGQYSSRVLSQHMCTVTTKLTKKMKAIERDEKKSWEKARMRTIR